MTSFHLPNTDKDITFLPKAESIHAVKVLRLQTGDLISITNGTGDVFTARIVHAHQKKCEIEILKHVHLPHPTHRIHIAVAPTKSNDRLSGCSKK